MPEYNALGAERKAQNANVGAQAQSTNDVAQNTDHEAHIG